MRVLHLSYISARAVIQERRARDYRHTATFGTEGWEVTGPHSMLDGVGTLLPLPFCSI
jgi:hypothetical protein